MIQEPSFRSRPQSEEELECTKFLLCLTIGNLAYNRTNRPLLQEMGAFTFLHDSITKYKVVLRNSWRTLQPFVPLLDLCHDILANPQSEKYPLWAVVTLAIICLEQFSTKFGERARHFLWRTFALNGTPATLQLLRKSPILKRKEHAALLEILLNLCKNVNLDTEQLSSSPVTNVAAREQPTVGLEDFGMLFNKSEMFADLAVIAPRQEGGESDPTRDDLANENEGVIYCHRAILSARCKVFAALFLRWETDEEEEEEESNGKESGEEREKDKGDGVREKAEETDRSVEADRSAQLKMKDDKDCKPHQKKKKKKKKKKKVEDKKTPSNKKEKKRKRDLLSPEPKFTRRRKGAAGRNQMLQQVVIRDVEFDTMYKIIEFIYKGCVDLDEACVVDILRAADIYALDALKLKCEIFLAESLDLENVAKLLEIANIYSAWHLEKRCREYIQFCFYGQFTKALESSLFTDLFERMPHYRETLASACSSSVLPCSVTAPGAFPTPPIRKAAVL